MPKKIKLKIAVLTEIINTHSGARAPLEIGIHLADLGHRVVIYAYDILPDRKTLGYLKRKNIEVRLVHKPNLSYISKYLIIPKLCKMLKKDQIQVIYFSGTFAFFLAAYLTKIPLIWMYQGIQFDAYLEKYLPGEINIFAKILNQLGNAGTFLISYMMFRLANEVSAVSRFAAHEAKILYKRTVKVIYNGTTIFPETKKARHKNIEILSVSRITPYKGFHTVIRALNSIKTPKEFRLTIIGSQPKIKYSRWLQKLGGNKLKIIIDPTDAELNRYYQNADIYVTADKYLYFGMPITEAAQFAIPAVALNFAAASEIIKQNETGFVADTFTEFKKYLKTLIENDKLRHTLGKKAKNRVKYFSWNKSAGQWEKILIQIFKNRK